MSCENINVHITCVDEWSSHTLNKLFCKKKINLKTKRVAVLGEKKLQGKWGGDNGEGETGRGQWGRGDREVAMGKGG